MSDLAWQQWFYLGIVIFGAFWAIVLAGEARDNWPEGGPLVFQLLLSGLVLWMVLSL